MATRALLAELAEAWRQRGDGSVEFESVGGVDAARRVAAREPFDIVVLAFDALHKLEAAGHVVAGSRIDLVRSEVAVAVRAGAARPDISTESALRDALLGARSIGCSTGPSGTALLQLFERWGLADALRERIVTAPPGAPVGALLASADVEIGFQQMSELMHLDGIDLLGPMPDGTQIVTTFSAGLCTTSGQPDGVRALIQFLNSAAVVETKRRHGMQPAG